MRKKLKITILALHLSVGGVEKTIATLSNILAKKYEVEIIANYKICEKPAFEIDEKVKIKYLMTNLKPNKEEFKIALKKLQIFKILKEGMKSIKILYLRRKLMINAIKNLSCDIAISTRYIHSSLLGRYGDKHIIKIAEEHNNNGNEKYIKRVIKSLKNIDYFMPASKQLTKMYIEKLKGTKTECIYIPHCLKYYPEETSKLTSKNIVSVGRLSSEKGFLDLIDVFEQVNNKNPDWNLHIAGDGVQKDEIIKKIQEKHLENNITVEFKSEKDLKELFLQSSIYIMTSFHESFGLVLIEAESFGIPLLAFDSAKGPQEIIENGKNGYLISNRDKKQMADMVNELICNDDMRIEMGNRAREMSEVYKMENVEKMWYEFIEKIL